MDSGVPEVKSAMPESVDPMPINDTPKDNHGITIAAMAVFVLLALGAIVFLYYQNQSLKNLLAGYQTPNSSPTPSATSDPTANWKTYTNNTYGINFKYPADTTYKITNFPGSRYDLVFSNLTQSVNTNMTIFIGNSWYFTNPKADTTKNFAIGGIQAYREDLPLGQNPPQSVIFVKNNSDFFTIQLVKDPIDTAVDQIFNQILSTFKFVAPTASPSAKPVACTQEAKVCPDGTTVGRTGPNCEFAPCPAY